MQLCIVDCFRSLSSWLSVRSSTWLMLAGVHTLHHCIPDHLPAISRTAWYCWTSHFLYKVVFHQYSIFCPLSRNILHKPSTPYLLLTHKHLLLFVFNGKTHNLQTRTSSEAKNIYFLHRWNTSFLLNIPWKLCWNLNIFHCVIIENIKYKYLPVYITV